ncbi:multiheme c-type cytochrome [Stieleria varia]|uniref:Cytochrome c-552/4 domain-containing protein n=1 Tax=Stieleria varia TaxID=2528005 RepID=A0A5C6B2B4_9BACT|nr:multiheme c-type cytochrome [Stieleria varia]TWU05711.1 hypothetical protein Pla52n_14260 [Stieleria varia]
MNCAQGVTAVFAFAILVVAAQYAPRPSGKENDGPIASQPESQPTFVGRDTCRECHAENHALHSKHGHASTFQRAETSDLVSLFAGKSFDSGESHGTYQYDSGSKQRLFATLKSQFGDSPFPLQYVLGSGQNAQTILTLAPGENGRTEGIEHRVSRYPGDRLGLTPGHSQMLPRSPLEYFGYSVHGEPLERCVYCHTTSAKIVGESIVDLVPNVNCEKCHGPGSEHIRLARSNTKPPAYSVGKDEWDAEAELQLCGDCHRLPRSLSEKELREYPDLLTRFQPVGMLRSRCYLESDLQLRCTTCHNPHRTIAEMPAESHIQNCLKCHQPESTTHASCPVESESGCIECHMPAIELDGGIIFHDHWIRVIEP